VVEKLIRLPALDQLLFGIGNELFVKWCPGIMNPKLNVVRAQSSPNLILIKLNSAKTLSPLYVGPIDKTEDWGTASLYWYWFECSVVACHERAR